MKYDWVIHFLKLFSGSLLALTVLLPLAVLKVIPMLSLPSFLGHSLHTSCLSNLHTRTHTHTDSKKKNLQRKKQKFDTKYIFCYFQLGHRMLAFEGTPEDATCQSREYTEVPVFVSIDNCTQIAVLAITEAIRTPPSRSGGD